MRALTRIRTLAAALMLLLFIATTALAGVPGRPKDRPEGPGEPNPAEIGDPDTGHGGLPALIRQLILAAQLSTPGLRRLALPLLQVRSRTLAELRQNMRGGGAK